LSRRFPVRNAKEVIRALRKHGFQQIDQSGSHQKWQMKMVNAEMMKQDDASWNSFLSGAGYCADHPTFPGK
jgi:hypothetical protein